MKTFGEVFGAYIPEMTRQLAEGTIERLQIRTAQRELIALLRFPSVLEKSTLLAAQKMLRQTLRLERVLLSPRYPAEAFTADYLPSLAEALRAAE